MTAQSRTVLKSYFQRGLKPTQSNYADLIDSFQLVSGASSYLEITGGAMTGSLQLRGVPVSALEAATKGYVDAIVSAGTGAAGGSNGQVQYNNSGVLGGFTVSGDCASLATTGVFTLANTAVSAGTCALPTITVDSKGRVTSAVTGSSSGIVRTVKLQVFTGSGTYTPSAGMLYCEIKAVGGGGGGGGSNVAANTTGGGGAGGYSILMASASTIGSSQTVTIGAGGSAGSAGGGNGGAGGTTTVGTLITCNGGNGGAGSGGGNGGGGGGTASSGNLNMQGANGGAGSGATSAAVYNGGASPFGTTINSYGAGASGVSGSSAGVAGSPGVVIITEFCSQ